MEATQFIDLSNILGADFYSKLAIEQVYFPYN